MLKSITMKRDIDALKNEIKAFIEKLSLIHISEPTRH